MTGEKKQLRGKKLEIKLRSVIGQMIAIEKSRGKEYEFIAKHVAEQVGCSRTTLMKYNPLIEEILATTEAGKRSKYGNIELTNLRAQVNSLKDKLTKKDQEIAELRAERFEMYDRLLKEGIDVASFFRESKNDSV